MPWAVPMRRCCYDHDVGLQLVMGPTTLVLHRHHRPLEVFGYATGVLATDTDATGWPLVVLLSATTAADGPAFHGRSLKRLFRTVAVSS